MVCLVKADVKGVKDDSSVTVDEALHHKEDDDESDEELFITPPSSPEDSSESASEDEMGTPDEGVDVYILGDAPTKLDVAVMQAIEGANFSPFEFPNIYRWRHSVLLHSEQERIIPSTKSVDQTRTPERGRCLQASTPPQMWHKITGPYSPMSPQR
ncbi:hypothetical protein C0J52_00963 [Blattella germanica]|nr:hypothetical protein C0J52_00963 [Blattella germanica]